MFNKKNTLTLKIFWAIILCDITSGIAQLCLKKGLLATGISIVHFGNFQEFIFRNLTSPLVWLGIAIFLLTFLLWIVILSRIDLSIAIPMSATGYIMIPLLAILFLKEHVSLLRWFGTLIIIAGAFFISRSAAIVPEKIDD